MLITRSQITNAILITNVAKKVIYMSRKAELKLMTIKSIIPIILTYSLAHFKMHFLLCESLFRFDLNAFGL